MGLAFPRKRRPAKFEAFRAGNAKPKVCVFCLLDRPGPSANNGGVSDHRFEIVDEQRRFDRGDRESFDRIQFALRALRILRPDMTVALYQRRRDLHIEQSRDLERGPKFQRALVGIPPDASREHIAFALAELAGVAERPFVVDLLARLTPKLP